MCVCSILIKYFSFKKKQKQKKIRNYDGGAVMHEKKNVGRRCINYPPTILHFCDHFEMTSIQFLL